MLKKTSTYINYLYIICILINVQCAAKKFHKAQNDLNVKKINFSTVFKAYNHTKMVQKAFDDSVKVLEIIAQAKKDSILKLMEEIEKSTGVQREKLQNSLSFKKENYKQYLETVFGKEGQVIKLNKSLTTAVLNELNKVIKAYCKTNGIDFLMDVRDSNVVFSKDKYNAIYFNKKRIMRRYCLYDFVSTKDIGDTIIIILNSSFATKDTL